MSPARPYVVTSYLEGLVGGSEEASAVVKAVDRIYLMPMQRELLKVHTNADTPETLGQDFVPKALVWRRTEHMF